MDGLTIEEEGTAGSDIKNRDTDKDGYLDGIEIKSGTDPLNSRSKPGDSDRDRYQK